MVTHCNGPCQQGRLPCPTPDACMQEVNDDAPQHDVVWVVLKDIAISAVLIAVIALIVMWAAK